MNGMRVGEEVGSGLVEAAGPHREGGSRTLSPRVGAPWPSSLMISDQCSRRSSASRSGGIVLRRCVFQQRRSVRWNQCP